MFERLSVPWGLVPYGVAPDPQQTKTETRLFERTARRPDMARYLNVEVGTHVSHDALLSHHHAVIYAVGAAHDRSLGIPGEDLPGSHSATEFVAWYNGHPGLAGRTFDLSATARSSSATATSPWTWRGYCQRHRRPVQDRHR
jgi:ferredoxin/flavodoxin---NADP+ reductase